MPFCPRCLYEYRREFTVCSDCNVKLVPVLPETMKLAMDFPEIYISYDRLEANLIRDLLRTSSIECLVRDMQVAPYPTLVGRSAEKRVAVQSDKVESAKKLITDARSNGEISADGEFIA